MRRWSWVVFLPLIVALVFAASQLPLFHRSRTMANLLPVPAGDHEIAWLHNPTSFENWDNFVWGVKRAEMTRDGDPEGLEVDDSGAFPHRTTAVPEIVVRRKGYEGSLRIRWYKVTDEATQEAWVSALAARDPPPLAVLGGWSSDRAKELAVAMRSTNWSSSRPLLFLGTATADTVNPDADTTIGNRDANLISLYDRSFRFCFTNRQMANAVADFVLSDPTLRPGTIGWPGLRTVPSCAAGPWAGLTALATETRLHWPPIPAFSIEWKDDPYSTDLSQRFMEVLQQRTGPPTDVPRLEMKLKPVPFSTGMMHRPNPGEAEVAESILSNLPRVGLRTVVVIPSVTAPTRRVIRALVQGNPAVGRQLVAMTGDGMGVNTFFRDRDFAWPVRSLTIPIVSFTHADPFGWDTPGSTPVPPRGYELEPPAPGAVRSSTEDIQLFTRLTRVVAMGAYPDGSTRIVPTPDVLATNLHSSNPRFFDRDGNRLSDTGEHIVVLRPVFPGEAPPENPQLDAVLEVYAHPNGAVGWQLLHRRTLSHHAAGRPE